MDLLEKMTTFVRVVEASSFSAAAKQLRVSSPAVSRQIATLEAELRTPLILRTTRRMVVTDAGRVYYERCLRVLKEVDEARAAVRGSAYEGRLQVTAPVAFGISCVVPHVTTLMTEHAGLRIDLLLEDRLADLALDGVDVAIRVGRTPPDSAELVAHRLLTFRRVAVAAPEYLKRKGEAKTPEALAKFDAIAYPMGAIADFWSFSNAERTARVRIDPVFRCNAVEAVLELALKGRGVALLPEWRVTEDVKRKALRVLLPDWQGELVNVNAIHRTDQRGAPRVRMLIDYLKKAYERAGLSRDNK